MKVYIMLKQEAGANEVFATLDKMEAIGLGKIIANARKLDSIELFDHLFYASNSDTIEADKDEEVVEVSVAEFDC